MEELKQELELIKHEIEQLKNAIFKMLEPSAQLNITQAAAMLNVDRHTISQYVATGRLKATRKGRVIRISKSELLNISKI